MKYLINQADVEPLKTEEREDFKGVTCKFLISGENVGSKGSLLRVSFAPGGYHGPHLHTESEEYVYIISGHGLKGVSDKVYDLKPGYCYYIPKNVTHWMKNTHPRETIEVVAVYPDSPSLDETGYKYVGPIPKGATRATD